MPRRKVVRTTEEEEEFQRQRREKRAISQIKRREAKRMMIQKDCQSSSNIKEICLDKAQTLTNFPKNIVIDHHVSTISVVKVVYPTNEVVTDTVSQISNNSPTTNISMVKDNNVNAMNDNMKNCNINSDLNIIQDIHNSIMETTSDNNIISPLPSTSNRLINSDDNNRFENLTILPQVLSQNVVMNNNTVESITTGLDEVNKNKWARYIERNRALNKGYTNINTSDVIQLQNVTEYYIGEMTIICEHCGAKHFNSEKVANKRNSFNDCCSHGSVELNPLPQPPHELYELFIGNHSKSRHFYDRIRAYNNSFSFASFNANVSSFNTQRPGPYCFKIQGQIYYQINTALYPAPNEIPSYGQLFIVDSNEARECRLRRNANLDEEILHSIDNIMRTNNVFAQSYRMMHEEIQIQQATQNQNIHELQLGFLAKRGIDRSQYN